MDQIAHGKGMPADVRMKFGDFGSLLHSLEITFRRLCAGWENLLSRFYVISRNRAKLRSKTQKPAIWQVLVGGITGFLPFQ
jgi:hypothetical protein